MIEVLGLVVDSDSIWYVSGNSQVLINLSKEFLVKKKVPLTKIQDFDVAYSDGIAYGDELIFAPMNGDGILFFNKKSHEYYFIKIDKPCNINCFNKIIQKDDTVFFVPWSYHALIEMNLKTKKLRYHTIPVESIKNGHLHSEYFFKEAFWFNEDIIGLPSYCSNEIVLYNYKNEKVSIMKIGEKDTFFQTCIYSDNLIYLLPRNENILYVLNKDFLEVDKIVLGENDSNIYKNLHYPVVSYYADIIDCGEYILAIQNESNNSYIIDKKTLKVKDIELVPHYFKKNKKMWNAKKISNKTIILTGLYNDSWLGEFDIDSKTIRWYELPSQMKNVFFRYPDFKMNVKEKMGADLCDFLGEIKLLN